MMRRATFALLACAGLALGCQREKTDSALNAEVLARLEHEPTLSTSQLAARTEQGHVVLSGEVATIDQRILAERVTDKVRGVKEVTNQIQVQPAAEPPRAQPAPEAAPPGEPAPETSPDEVPSTSQETQP